jgi:CRP/FNR family cyclic AMP-dependent transcriptional regulator
MSYVALDIFEHLRPEDTQWILASAELKTIAGNSLLVREDEPSDSIFFIADGLFEVYVFGGLMGQIKVGQLGAGEVIGEISWLDRKPVSASVRAAETSSVIALSTAMLDRKLADDAGFAARFLRGIATLTAERLRKTTAQVRRAEWAAGERKPTGGSAEGNGVLDRIAQLKGLIAEAEQSAAGAAASIPQDPQPGYARPSPSSKAASPYMAPSAQRAWPTSCKPSCCRPSACRQSQTGSTPSRADTAGTFRLSS